MYLLVLYYIVPSWYIDTELLIVIRIVMVGRQAAFSHNNGDFEKVFVLHEFQCELLILK